MVDGVNLYEYVRGNPVKLTDPDGMESEEGDDTKSEMSLEDVADIEERSEVPDVILVEAELMTEILHDVRRAYREGREPVGIIGHLSFTFEDRKRVASLTFEEHLRWAQQRLDTQEYSLESEALGERLLMMFEAPAGDELMNELHRREEFVLPQGAESIIGSYHGHFFDMGRHRPSAADLGFVGSNVGDVPFFAKDRASREEVAAMATPHIVFSGEQVTMLVATEETAERREDIQSQYGSYGEYINKRYADLMEAHDSYDDVLLGLAEDLKIDVYEARFDFAEDPSGSIEFQRIRYNPMDVFKGGA